MGNIKLSRVLIDSGTLVNIMNINIPTNFKVDMHSLSSYMMMLYGFKKIGEKALSSIALLLEIKEFKIEVKFYIIYSEMLFNALLGRLWINEGRIVFFTQHN